MTSTIQKLMKLFDRKTPSCPACRVFIRDCQQCEAFLCENPDCEGIEFVHCLFCSDRLCSNVFPCCARTVSCGGEQLSLCHSCMKQALKDYVVCECRKRMTTHFATAGSVRSQQRSFCGNCWKSHCLSCLTKIRKGKINNLCFQCTLDIQRFLLTLFPDTIRIIQEYHVELNLLKT